MHIAEWEKPVWKAVKFYLHNILEKTELQRWYCSMVLRGSRVGRLNKWYTGGIWRVMKLFSCDTVMANGLPWWLISKESACNAGTMETQIWFLGREESLEEGMATHSSILACRIPRTEELSRLQSTRLQSHTWLKWFSVHIMANTQKYIFVKTYKTLQQKERALMYANSRNHWGVKEIPG